MSSIRPVENLNTANKVVGHYIDGQVIIDSDERTQPIYNPATGRITRRVALAAKATVEKAVAAAAAAYPEWRRTPPIKRARIMFRFKDLLEQHANEITSLLTEEHGKVSG